MTGHADPADGRMASTGGWEALAPALGRTGLSLLALHERYVGLGGCATAGSLAGHFSHGGELTASEHDLAVLAINERFLEMNRSERLSYITPSPLD